MDMSSLTTQLQGLQSSVAGIEDRLSDTSKTITALSENLSTVQESWRATTKRVQEMVSPISTRENDANQQKTIAFQRLIPKLLSFFVVIMM